VEKVICYDVFSSPIRGIQRMGRTGRHEEGHVIHIVSEGHEEGKLEANRQVATSLPYLEPLAVCF
jgi:ERCC4-related helicase